MCSDWRVHDRGTRSMAGVLYLLLHAEYHIERWSDKFFRYQLITFYICELRKEKSRDLFERGTDFRKKIEVNSAPGQRAMSIDRCDAQMWRAHTGDALSYRHHQRSAAPAAVVCQLLERRRELVGVFVVVLLEHLDEL